ncbi:MAG: hypothetical protein U1F43_11740 [Myxococcota bacterium]
MKTTLTCLALLSFGACDDAAAPPTPPDETLGALCLTAVPTALDFVGEHPGDARQGSFAVTTCDGSAWHAEVSQDGEGFISRQRLLTPEGLLRDFAGRSTDVMAGDRLALDVMYLARTIDDGAVGQMVVRGRDDAGRVGRISLALSGSLAATCAECGCCDDSVPPALPSWSVEPSPHFWIDPNVDPKTQCHSDCPGHP